MIIGIFMVIIPLIIGIMGVRIVSQAHRAIVEQFGKYKRYLEPGINWIIPFIEKSRQRDIRSHTLDIAPACNNQR